MTVVHSSPGVKFWIESPPAVDEVRPSSCPDCGVASRPVGEPIVVVGHGKRERGVAWLKGPDEVVEWVTVFVRRFLCLACKTTITVLPKDLSPWRRYSLCTITVALALWSMGAQSAQTVRDGLLGDQLSFEAGWPVLRSWARAVEFSHLAVGDGPPKRRAAWITQRIAGRAPPEKRRLSIVDQAFFGAAYVM